MDRFFSERALHEGGAIERGARRARGREHVYPARGRGLAAHARRFGDDKDRVLMRSTGELTYFAADIAYHEDKLERGYDRVDRRAGRRPPRLRRPRCRAAWQALGGDPERLRDPDHAARQPDRGRRARADVEARGRVRHARRPARRHRRGRRALVPAAAQPRHHARPRPRAGAPAVAGQPGLLRAVRARADREHPAQGGRGAGAGGARGGPGRQRRAAAPVGALAGQAAARVPRRGGGCGRSGARRTASPPTRTRPPRSSRPSTATARWSARPRRAATRTSAWPCA